MKARARLTAPRTRNKTEEAYAQRLELLRRGGEIKDWRYEEIKFQIGQKCWYTPDFMVVNNDLEIEFHEVKGFLRDDALVKFKAVADAFPEFVWIMVKKTKKGWEEIYKL